MDFDLSAEQQAVADVVTSALSRDFRSATMRPEEESGKSSPSFAALVDGGVTALPVPERLGGDGVGLAEVGTVLTEVGRHGLVAPVLATLGFGVVPLLELASDEQQDRFLAAVPKGGVLTAALNEPGAALPDRPSVVFADGRLSGTKVGVAYAESADWLIVTADGAVVVVSPRADGVQLVRTPTSSGSDEYVVTFDGVAVADSDVLAGASARRVNQLALAAIGAYADGLVAGALRLTADYVAGRKQFGKPLSTFQTVAAQLAEVYIASRTIDLASKSVIWRLADGRDADADLDVLGYWITSQAPPAMQLCHHLHGGMGMDITYPMHRYYSTIKDLTRLLGGPANRLELVGAQCSSN
ncbi:acyl-CoA dehydrogenase family protein [Mycobacterium angelicum]|uniref:Acyl-CoA dehydrogenase n=1 Tax=Mycobacterium angelicum TaxID=470074 RepID=A0A1W9ZDS3_MYCAN|nr:acyl-CoA dehydrogenase family protein [Mycobacterium angelicum]MCV7199931.1 acyl-CoA/acyl-ACP dehydrogenase [Mycobacterium angelicum]ORA12656.1 acyl-CoA dehydrogenase [Mycobacterium angelicum]